MSNSVEKIAEALVEAQKKMGNAVKDSRNPFFKSKYADINSVREAVLPALNEVGISVWQPTVYFEGKKFVKTIFMHVSGQFLAGLTEIVYMKEGDPQAQIAGTTYARRGGLQSMANIGAEDDDGNEAAGKTVPFKVEKIVAPKVTAPLIPEGVKLNPIENPEKLAKEIADAVISKTESNRRSFRRL